MKVLLASVLGCFVMACSSDDEAPLANNNVTDTLLNGNCDYNNPPLHLLIDLGMDSIKVFPKRSYQDTGFTYVSAEQMFVYDTRYAIDFIRIKELDLIKDSIDFNQTISISLKFFEVSDTTLTETAVSYTGGGGMTEVTRCDKYVYNIDDYFSVINTSNWSSIRDLQCKGYFSIFNFDSKYTYFYFNNLELYEITKSPLFF